MDSLTLDQIQILLTVVDEGSFSKAAKKLNRAQSAVTYGIQKLEAQIDIPLFDRSAYRPALTEAGRTLLLRARRIAEETNAFRDAARESLFGVRQIPCFHQLPHPRRVVLVRGMHPNEPPHQLYARLTRLDDLQPVLPPQVTVRLAAQVSARWRLG